MTSPDRRLVAAGERSRTEVNEPKTEPRPRAGGQTDGTASAGPATQALRLKDAADRRARWSAMTMAPGPTKARTARPTAATAAFP
jgi:hypothetical protein